MNGIDLSNLRLLSKGEGLRVYELVDDYVNFVDGDVSCILPRLGGDWMELVKFLVLRDRLQKAINGSMPLIVNSLTLNMNFQNGSNATVITS